MSVHLCFSCKKRFLLLLQLKADNAKPLSGEVKLCLQLSGLSSKFCNLILSFFSPHLGYFAGLLANITPVTGIVLLHLHGLHLLLDCVHCEAFVMLPYVLDYFWSSLIISRFQPFCKSHAR